MITTTALVSLPAFACDLKAISPADRPRYDELLARVRSATRDRNEVPNGYAFQLDSRIISLAEVAERISMERLCCPFLMFQISASGNQPDCVMTVTGPEGARPLLNAAFAIG